MNKYPKSPELRDEEASQNEAFYWRHHVNDETLSKLSAYDKKIMVEASLWTNMGKPEVKAPSAVQERLAYHEFTDWRPKTYREAFAASHTGRARKSVEAIKAFWDDARSDQEILSKAKTTQGISMGRVRADYDILYVLADNLMCREFWASGRWPDRRRREEKQEYLALQRQWRGFMVAAAQFAGDETLRDFYEQVLNEADARDKYWSGEFNLVPVPKAGRIAIEGAIQSSKPEASTPTDYEAMMPADVKDQLETRRQEYEELWERLDKQSLPQWRKQQILWQQFPEFKPGEVIEAEELKERTSRRPKSGIAPKRRRFRAGPLGRLNADGPPPGVEDSRRHRF